MKDIFPKEFKTGLMDVIYHSDNLFGIRITLLNSFFITTGSREYDVSSVRDTE